jgi:hypothetical protein
MVTVAWGFFKDDEIHVYGDPGIPCVKTTGDDFDLAVAPEQALGSTITIEGDTLTLVGYEHLTTPATTQWCMRFEETDQTGLYATRWYDEDTGVLLKTLWQGDHEVWVWNMETNQGA